MQRRFDYQKASPEALKQMLDLAQFVRKCGLEQPLLNVVLVRASLVNGCAYCIDMHMKNARAAGESEHRLYQPSAWREALFYSDKESAVLEWTVALKLIKETHVADEVYERIRLQFSEQELANLSLAIVTINGWNRLMIAFREPAGSYRPAEIPRQAA